MAKKKLLKRTKRSSVTNNSDSPSPVGYGKPPVERRWKPGQSGNPTGRPKTVFNYLREYLKVFTDPMRVQDGTKIRQLPRYLVIARKLVENALKGDLKSQISVLQQAKILGLLPTPIDGSNITAEAVKHLTLEELEQLLRISEKLTAAEGLSPPDKTPT